MGLLENDFIQIYKKVYTDKEMLDNLVGSLVRLVERQQTAFSYVRWSDEARAEAKAASEDLQRLMDDYRKK